MNEPLHVRYPSIRISRKLKTRVEIAAGYIESQSGKKVAPNDVLTDAFDAWLDANPQIHDVVASEAA